LESSAASHTTLTHLPYTQFAANDAHMGHGKTRPARKTATATATEARDADFLAFCQSFALSRGLPLLNQSADPGYFAELFTFLSNETAGTNIDLGRSPVTEFISHCSRLQGRLPDALCAALEQRKREVELNRKAKRRFIADVGLMQGSNEDRLAALEACATLYSLRELPDEVAYPPKGFLACETEVSKAGWSDWVLTRNLHDKRDTQAALRAMLCVDPDMLKLIVPKDKDVIVRDEETGEIVLIVRRNLCSDAEVLAGTDNTVVLDCSMKKGAQLDDPGKLVLVGYSAGSRSSPAFDYSRNIEAKKLSEEFVRSHHMAVSSSFSLFYQLMRANLPNEVLEDYEEYIAKHGFPRMDARGAIPVDDEGCGDYYVKKGGKTFTFHGAKLAPPAGVAGVNYARQASH
ncbi:hypothetical protein EVJ58_g6174, partial [Rhodofomes roseus]